MRNWLLITFQPKPFNCFFLKGFLSGMNGNFAQNSISSFKDTTGKEITFQCHGIFASKSSTCTLCHQFNRKGRQEVRERVERSSADIRREYNYWQKKRFRGMQWKSDDKCSNQKHVTWGHSPKPEVALLGVAQREDMETLCTTQSYASFNRSCKKPKCFAVYWSSKL